MARVSILHQKFISFFISSFRASEINSSLQEDLRWNHTYTLSNYPSITADNTPLPPLDPSLTPEEDEALFVDEPWVEPPILFDYGTNIVLGPGVFLNVNTTIIDTCKVYIGARTMFGPNVSLYSGCHPLDPELRNGLKGPEFGKEIHVGEDCWIGGCAIILPGVKVGKGCVIGAGSVVTKDVPDYTVVAGNPARKIKDVPRNTISEEERLRVLDIAMSGVEAKE